MAATQDRRRLILTSPSVSAFIRALRGPFHRLTTGVPDASAVAARFLACAAVVIVISAGSATAWALGMENFGIPLLSPLNYTDWPEIMPVLRNGNCVYHWWVNGNEGFHYRGDVQAMNESLRLFAAVENKARTVLIRPGPGKRNSFQGKPVEFDWDIHAIGGVVRAVEMPTENDPLLTIYVGKDLPVEKLEIPEGLPVLTVWYLKKRLLHHIKGADKEKRGHSAFELASLDPYDGTSLEAVVDLLADKDEWVRRCAVSALPQFGAKAKSKVFELRKAELDGDQNMKDAVARAIRLIDEAPEYDVEAEKAHRLAQAQIVRFVKTLSKPDR